MPTILANVIQDAFGPLIKVFEAILVFIHAHITGGSWGLAIIGLTIVVRAALVPLTLKQFSSMSKLQALGPELKELQKRYKDDKPRLNEEMMKFYKENEVNPFGSCLPLVLQLPVFLSLFYMLRLDLKKHICGAALNAHHIVTASAISKASCGQVDPHSGKFLFIPDVTNKATGVVLAVLIVLYIGSQLVSSLLTTATVDRNQRLMMLGLPFVFSIFISGFPAGLILYWITTNLWTVGQQYIVRKRASPIVAMRSPTGGAKDAASPVIDKPVPQGLLARLTATRDAARSAVTGVSRDEAVTKNGKPPPSSATPSRAKQATAKSKPGTAGSARGGPAKGAARASGAAAAAKPAGAKPRSGKPAGAKPASATPGSGKPTERAAPAKPKTGGRPATGDPADGSGGDAAPSSGVRRAPPPPPRKKKKRSGRRR